MYTTFLHKLLHNKIDDSFLLNNITFKINKHNIRNKELFSIKYYSQNNMSCTAINILSSTGSAVNQLDIFFLYNRNHLLILYLILYT